jgi:hypothetical protein
MGGPRHAIVGRSARPPHFGRAGPFGSRLRLLFSAFALALWASAVLWFLASERARADRQPSNRIPGATVTRSNSNYDSFMAPRNTPVTVNILTNATVDGAWLQTELLKPAIVEPRRTEP